jgi:hypothetical protein
MSDFTKEELERILEGIIWWLDGDSALYSEALIDKIQSMIDNYCEHKSPWINIKDRLPDTDHVIAYCQSYPYNFVSMVRFEQRHPGEYYFWDDSLDKKAHVTHWMPLPYGPK